MNAIIAKNIKSVRFFPFAKVFGLCLAMVLLLSGCLTTTPEDDYVAAVLAEAMQEYGAVGTMPAVEAAPLVAYPTSIQESSTVSVSAPPPVSVSAGRTVSIVQPPAVSIVPPVEAKPSPAVTPAPAEQVSPEVPVINLPAPEVGQPAMGLSNEVFSLAPDSGTNTKLARPKPTIATIQPDSVLWVSVTEDPSLNGRYMVNDASAIDFGYVGLVFLPDLRVEQAEVEIKRVLEGRYLKNATVSVKLAKASYDRVAVQGKVMMPGEIKIGPGATISLNEALRRAGGLRAGRESSRVKIIRGGVKTPFGVAAEGDVYLLMGPSGQMKVPDIFLRNDDLAYVFTPATEVKGDDSAMTGTGGKRVILLGEVPRRGVIEFSENEPCTLMYLLFKIGGLPRFARGDKILIVRRDKEGQDKKFTVNGEKLMKSGRPEDDLVLETGDRIVVPARSISFL